MFVLPGDRVGGKGIVGPRTGGLVAVLDGGGATLTTGVKGYLEFPFACTLTQCDMLADQSGSIIVNIWKCSYSQFDAGTTHPVVGDSIVASDKPTISTATKSTDSALTGWTVQISAGDILAFNVESVTSIQRLTMTLSYRR